MILHVLLALVAGWINRHQQQVITYLQEDNRVLTSQSAALQGPPCPRCLSIPTLAGPT